VDEDRVPRKILAAQKENDSGAPRSARSRPVGRSADSVSCYPVNVGVRTTASVTQVMVTKASVQSPSLMAPPAARLEPSRHAGRGTAPAGDRYSSVPVCSSGSASTTVSVP
jgi:hypothetical protein